MAIKRINEFPTITDQIIFDLTTPDLDGCYFTDPKSLDSIVIYFLERGFNGNVSDSAYNLDINRDDLLQAYASKQAEYCSAIENNQPTETLQSQLTAIQARLEMTKQTETFYYKNALPVYHCGVYGDDLRPAWIYGMVNPGEVGTTPDWPILHIDKDADNNTQYGQFELQWNPIGMREGDYFICWTWHPYLNDSVTTLTSHMQFSLSGNTQVTTAIPTHYTDPNKYRTLLERYLPEMFKQFLMGNDLSPQVLFEFNNAVGDTFTVLEDLANQMLDLIDSNATPESFLPWLGNLFNLKLRSSDPTLWRRQIKRAIPVYKKKGTLKGLTEALAQAGVYLTGYSQRWQVVSPYTWQEAFTYNGNGNFTLEKSYGGTTTNDPNFELYYRRNGVWHTLALASSHALTDFFHISTSGGITSLTLYTGYTPIVGDEIRIIYKVTDPGSNQTVENYIRALPLADQRDELDPNLLAMGGYPLKNWNLRLIRDDDPHFQLIIPTRNPWYDFLIYGQIRTEFAYSENIYNMEEYNGSTRDSTNPCHIDKTFVDTCSGGLSSFYDVELEFDELTDTRLEEAEEIVREYTPFHASLFQMGTSAIINDFIKSPLEQIQSLIKIKGMETLISNGQLIFDRLMNDGLIAGGSGEAWPATVLKEDLATLVPTYTSVTGSIRNAYINLFWNAGNFKDLCLGLNQTGTYLEILSGYYRNNAYTLKLDDSLYMPQGNHVTVLGVGEPLNSDPLTFRLSLNLYSPPPPYANISRRSDPGANLRLDQGWKPNQALVAIADPSIILNKFLRIGDYVYCAGQQYYINQFLPNNTLVVDDFPTGQLGAGIPIIIYRRLLDNQAGSFYYTGTILDTTPTNYELIAGGPSLPIMNGANAASILPSDSNGLKIKDSSLFKEDFLISIGSDLFTIAQIDGTTITLSGPEKNWGTAGQSVQFTINQYQKKQVTIPEKHVHTTSGHIFQSIDRGGGGGSSTDIIEHATIQRSSFSGLFELDTVGFTSSLAPLMDAANKDQIVDVTGVKESINYQIKWAEEVK